MAIDLTSAYSGKVDATDTDYPYGKARGVTISGDGTGTPFAPDWFNDWGGFFQRLLVEAGITPSGTPDNITDSDYWDALVDMVGAYTAPNASTTVKGVTEYATIAETIAGTDATRSTTPAGVQGKIASDATVQTGASTTTLVSPAGLRACTATDTRPGVVELATDAETITGADATRSTTPAGVQAKLDSVLSGTWVTSGFTYNAAWSAETNGVGAFKYRLLTDNKIELLGRVKNDSDSASFSTVITFPGQLGDMTVGATEFLVLNRSELSFTTVSVVGALATLAYDGGSTTLNILNSEISDIYLFNNIISLDF